MSKRELLKERYSVIVTSQTDARKRTLVFSITQRVLFLVLCFLLLTVLLSASIIIGSQYKTHQFRIQIAHLRDSFEKQSADMFCSHVSEIESFASIGLISSFNIDNTTQKDTNESSSTASAYESKEIAKPYTSITSEEKIAIPRADNINEDSLKQLTSLDMIDAIKIIDLQFEDKVQEKISDVLKNQEYDEINVVYTGDFEGDSDWVNNWADVLSIFLALNMYDDQRLLNIPSDKIDMLTKIYNSMNDINVSIVKEPYTEERTFGSQDSPILTVRVTINSLTYMEGVELYELDKKQKAKLEQLMSPDYYIYFSELLGIDVYSGMDYEEVREIIDSLPDTTGGEVVRAALIRLGSPYSRSRRGSGDYVDCSYFAWWSYNQAGISIPTSSVMQAKYCYDNEFNIKASELQPGDLIFWTKKNCHCGRWHEIHHVGIYISDNTIIEASSGKGCVSIRPLWGIDGKTWKIFMYARPE